MITNPFFSSRISQGLYDHIEEYPKETDKSKTDVLIGVLAKYEENKSNTPPAKKIRANTREKLDKLL